MYELLIASEYLYLVSCLNRDIGLQARTSWTHREASWSPFLGPETSALNLSISHLSISRPSGLSGSAGVRVVKVLAGGIVVA